jgi:hypothetical protein
MLLNHKHKTATNISRRRILSNDTRPPSDLPVSSGLSFLDRESGDSTGSAEAGRRFSAPHINFVKENIIMELATFKKSILTQINVIKQCLCVCTYVCLLDFWLFVYLFFVCL